MIVIPFNECCSHPGRPLSDHHGKVAGLMHRAASELPGELPEFFADLVRLVGLFHDLGKGTTFFQNGRLKGQRIKRRELGNHASLSALLCFSSLRSAVDSWCDDSQVADFYFLAAVMAIRRHHGALKDFEKAVARLHEEDEEEQLKAIDIAGVEAYLERCVRAMKVDSFAFSIPTKREIQRSYRKKLRDLKKSLTTDEFTIAGQLFSLLIWADKIDAATAGNTPGLERADLSPQIVDHFREVEFGEPKTPLDQLRDEVYQTVESNLLNNDSKLFTLTSPTGSAKTLAILNAALKRRTNLSKLSTSPSRIIYCLPFTSIIDQNHAVFEAVLRRSNIEPTDDRLLKHHHLADPKYVDRDETDYGYNVGQLLTSSWDSEIVVTTFIQLLNAMLGKQNKMLRKLLRVPGSIILLDEVQAIPRGYWETVERILTAYAERFDCQFVLLTATRPLILNQKNTVELLPQYPQIFAEFDRYDILVRCEDTIEFSDFKDQVSKLVVSEPDKRHLIVMNTVQSSIEVFEHLRRASAGIFGERQLLYLSTNITPMDRRKRIDAMRASGDPCVIVSTQVIEAGVDISVDVVHRDLAPLDSIIQSAGRCNRSGERPQKGKVFVWNIKKDENEWRFSYIYPRLLLRETNALLVEYGSSTIPETDVLMLSEQYFDRAKSVVADKEVHGFVRSLEFEEVHNRFKLIDDDAPRDAYFVRRESDPDSIELWREYKLLQEIDDLLTRRKSLQAIKRDFFDRVVQIRVERGADAADGILLLTDDKSMGDHYDENVGFTGGGFAIF